MSILLAACAVLYLVVHKFLVYPLFLSPLSKIPPAHPTSHVFPFWIY